MCHLCRLFNASIGKKVLVAVAGLLLCGFLVTHLAGNLLLFASEGTFNNYAKTLESQPLLPLAEALLALIFFVHIAWSIKVRWENKKARPVAYEMERAKGGRTPGSRTMSYTAALVLLFLVVHIKTFKFGNDEQGLYNLVMTSFRNPFYAGFYVVSLLALMLHLSHGFQSAFQTLGLNHPRYTPLIKKTGMLFALVIAGGFLVIPIWAFVKGGR
jgi:succinate dehydrogenase / fumarate reductase cytochrome b subunit